MAFSPSDQTLKTETCCFWLFSVVWIQPTGLQQLAMMNARLALFP
jgi:hypothetical protein